jgi:hypothetical protein
MFIIFSYKFYGLLKILKNKYHICFIFSSHKVFFSVGFATFFRMKIKQRQICVSFEWVSVSNFDSTQFQVKSLVEKVLALLNLIIFLNEKRDCLTQNAPQNVTEYCALSVHGAVHIYILRTFLSSS